MQKKLVLIVGAGATRSDASQKSEKYAPPLDRGFFNNSLKAGATELSSIRRYLKENYDFDPLQPEKDSLENTIAVVYADIFNPRLKEPALDIFRKLIRLFNRRMAETTNPIGPTNRGNLYRIICQALDDGYRPEDICLITFNQDIQIEKALFKIQNTQRGQRHGQVFNFPHCYFLPNADRLLSSPPKSVPVFPKGDNSLSTIAILKLHGSLNWYSTHKSARIPRDAILKSTRPYYITPRMKISLDMTFSTGKRKMYTFPLVVPPVTHKAGILHEDMHELWGIAEKKITEATSIVVFGYSCPESDFESANLIRRAVRDNDALEEFSVIDPNPGIFSRYVDLTGLNRLYYFRNPNSFLSAK